MPVRELKATVKSPAIRRRDFVSLGAMAPFLPAACWGSQTPELAADVIIIGGGLGGCAAALACLQRGLRVILTEPTDWIGGQLTSQGVPPDEHRWIETHGANQSYRSLRQRIRQFYRDNYQLTEEARRTEAFNPGRGSVSRLCCEPRSALAVLDQWFRPYLDSGHLTILLHTDPITSDVSGDRIQAVQVRSKLTHDARWLIGGYFVDASELGDLLLLTNTEFVTGSEARSQTGELHAGESADPDNQQAFTMCCAIDYVEGGYFTLPKPAEYSFWRDFLPQLTPSWPGRLLDLTYTHPRTLQPKALGFNPTGSATQGSLNLWNYRRIIDHRQFEPGQFDGDISLVNWPQNDYFRGNLVGVSPEEATRHIDHARQLTLSLVYWLQTEVARADGGQGYPGIRLRTDILGTEDGLAKAPYIRESRRIVAELTITEQHVGVEQRRQLFGDQHASRRAHSFADSVGVGSYAIDLHPTTGGDNYIDFETYPFQIPLGCMLPVRMENLVPACKNIGTTHLTSGCYRLHPVEWGIGEAAGLVISYAIQKATTPRAIRNSRSQLEDFQAWIRHLGVETHWPE